MDSYFDPRAPGSFGGIDALLRHVNALADENDEEHQTRDTIAEWLLGQPSYTQHYRVQRKFKRNRTVVYTIYEQFQADLIDVSALSEYNDGVNFLLTVIDVFSKQARVVPLKNKAGKTVRDALEKIFEEFQTPEKFQTDEGKEFENAHCYALYKKLKIKHFNALSGESKCAVNERFNRTFKTKLWKYLTHNNTYRFIDDLGDLEFSYNNTYHSAIKMKPSEVNYNNVNQVWQNLFGDHFRNSVMRGPRRKFKFQLGDNVRLSGKHVTFKKAYEQGWTEELFTVSRRLMRDPPVYNVKDENDEEVKGVFYEQEMLRVKKPTLYPIEKIISSRGKGKNRKHLVKWRGYSKSFNSWIPNSDVVDLKNTRKTK
jgi:Integrase core domain/Chromo (CHRromatin Organisation MOdifier) domain